MKIIFVGTTDFGIPTLELLATHYSLQAVVTQPDKPVGRKKILTPPPIKVWAEKNKIKVLQSEKILNLKTEILNLEPDLLLVAAYGQIIPKIILDIPKFGSINIHASLLPKYRGATPIQNSIINGDGQTGVTLIKMDEKMDHGPIIAQTNLTIDEEDNYHTLHKKLGLLAANLVSVTLPKWFAGQIKETPQNHSLSSFTSLLTHKDGRLDWSEPAININNKIRALNPEPGTWTTLDQKNVKILEAKILPETKIELIGKLYKHNGELAIKCQDFSLLIQRLILDGKNEMSGKEFANGLKNLENKIFV